jgi:tyrosyl-tRNA synthetase
MADLTPAERLALINENLQETLNPEIIEQIIKEGRHPKIYWGESPRHARSMLCSWARACAGTV